MESNTNTNNVAPRSTTFRVIKIILIVIQVLSIIGAIYLIAVGLIALGLTEKETYPKDSDTIAIVFIVSGIIATLLAILGLFAAIKEHFCLAVTYGVIMAIIAIVNLVSSSFMIGVIDLIVAGIAFYFAYLIRGINKSQNMA